MAQETILKVSLKDYKKGIDDLRAALLGLDKDSEEYGKIVQEIAERQDNLNDAMNAGKQAVNAVDGSYNALAQTLSNLKKEWKNMEMGTPEWEAMAVRINDINNQLKDADASVGVFTRNVGDYANAFEEAFKQAVGGLSSMPGIIGSIGSTTKQLIPLIQKASATATAGLNGVKKAIVSTGIGALIVAVGLLITHFDDLRKLFKKNNPVEDAQKAFDAQKASIDAANDSLSLEIELMEAEGATTEQVRLKKIELIKAQQAQTQAQLDNVRATIKQIEAHSAFRRWITGEKKELEGLKELEQELFELDTKQSKEITKLLNSNTADSLKKKKQAADEEKKKLDEVLKRVKENSKSEIQILTEKYNEEYALLKKHGKDTTELTKQYQKNVEKINKSALDAVFSEMGNYDPAAAFYWNFGKASEKVEQFQKIVNRKFPPEGLLETEDITKDMIQQAQKLGLVAGNTTLEFTIAWQNAYQNYKSIAKDFLKAAYEDDKEWQEMMDNLWDDERFSEYYRQLLSNSEGTFNILQSDLADLSETLKQIEAGTFDYAAEGFDSLEEAALWYKTLIPELEKLVDKYGKDIENIMKASANYQTELKNIEIEQQNILYGAWVNAAELGTQWFYDVYQKRLEAAQWFRDNLETIEGETEAERMARVIAADKAILDVKKEYVQKHIEISQSLNDDLLSVWNSIIDIRESNLKKQENIEVKALRERMKKQGKGEQEINDAVEKVKYDYEKRAFEQSKKSKISLGWIDTIQGALASFMGYQEFPQPYGAILGAAAAAATMAAGVAQIRAIEASEFGEPSNSSSPVAVVNATPRLADYQPDTIQNLTGASETQNLANALQQTPIYVSVTDINNAQAKVTDRNNESSF